MNVSRATVTCRGDSPRDAWQLLLVGEERSDWQKYKGECGFYRVLFFFFQAEDGIRDVAVTGVQTCALPISSRRGAPAAGRPRVRAGRARRAAAPDSAVRPQRCAARPRASLPPRAPFGSAARGGGPPSPPTWWGSPPPGMPCSGCRLSGRPA